MGHFSEMQIEMREEGQNRVLADALGITVDELDQLDHRIESNTGNDDMVYDYTVYFSDDAPKEILDKIDGLDTDSNSVTIPLNTFDSPDDFDSSDEEV